MKCLAIDIGAESGRGIEGWIEDGRLQIREVARFPNKTLTIGGSLRWDIESLASHVFSCVAASSEGLTSVGVDTWAVDFVLLDKEGQLIEEPYHYRDSRTDGMMEEVFKIIPRRELYDLTGIQFLPFNTIFQLYAARRQTALSNAQTFLTIPDYLNRLLLGANHRPCCEFTNATTTQLLSWQTGGWALELLEKLDIPTKIFPNIIRPGTVLGTMPSGVNVIAPACHDTGSAVAAVPDSESTTPPRPDIGKMVLGDAKPKPPSPVREVGSFRICAWQSNPDTPTNESGELANREGGERVDREAQLKILQRHDTFAWISSGTWSVMGVEVPTAVVNDASYKGNFTNEGGVAGTYRLSKNVMGLWLLQQCRATWAKSGKEYGYEELVSLASSSNGSLFDVDDGEFLKPGDMPSRIVAHIGGESDNMGFIVRSILESLAEKYSLVLKQLEELVGRRLDRVHIIGGGSQNRLLNQLTANACGRPVIAGPVEATAIGNLMVQMVALGEISSIAEGREMIKRSFPVEVQPPS